MQHSHREHSGRGETGGGVLQDEERECGSASGLLGVSPSCARCPASTHCRCSPPAAPSPGSLQAGRRQRTCWKVLSWQLQRPEGQLRDRRVSLKQILIWFELTGKWREYSRTLVSPNPELHVVCLCLFAEPRKHSSVLPANKDVLVWRQTPRSRGRTPTLVQCHL